MRLYIEEDEEVGKIKSVAIYPKPFKVSTAIDSNPSAP